VTLEANGDLDMKNVPLEKLNERKDHFDVRIIHILSPAAADGGTRQYIKGNSFILLANN
jgi:hypothetical protein